MRTIQRFLAGTVLRWKTQKAVVLIGDDRRGQSTCFCLFPLLLPCFLRALIVCINSCTCCNTDEDDRASSFASAGAAKELRRIVLSLVSTPAADHLLLQILGLHTWQS